MTWEGDPTLTAKMLSAGEEFVERTRMVPGVISILFIGGLARGKMDRFSDLDMIVLVDEPDNGASRAVSDIARDLAEKHAIDVDAEVHPSRTFGEREWDEVRRWDMSNCRIAHDPLGIGKEIVERGTAMTRSDWEARVVMNHMVLRWYLFSGGAYPSMVDIWTERGDLLSAHRCLDHVIETIMDLVFALNERFVPPAKWKVQCLRDLPEKPEGLMETLSMATLVRSMDREEARRRGSLLLGLKDRLDDQVVCYMGMPDEEVVRYYIEKLM